MGTNMITLHLDDEKKYDTSAILSDIVLNYITSSIKSMKQFGMPKDKIVANLMDVFKDIKSVNLMMMTSSSLNNNNNTKLTNFTAIRYDNIVYGTKTISLHELYDYIDDKNSVPDDINVMFIRMLDKPLDDEFICSIEDYGRLIINNSSCLTMLQDNTDEVIYYLAGIVAMFAELYGYSIVSGIRHHASTTNPKSYMGAKNQCIVDQLCLATKSSVETFSSELLSSILRKRVNMLWKAQLSMNLCVPIFDLDVVGLDIIAS